MPPFGLFDRILPTGSEAELATFARELSAAPGPPAATDRAPLAASLNVVAGAGYLVPQPTIPVALGRGCYWRRCHLLPGSPSWCTSSMLDGSHGILVAPGRRRFPAGAMLHFCDSALAPPQLEHLAGFIARERLPISWHGFARVEPALGDVDFAHHLARGGCAMLQLGVESASPRLLERMGKGASPDEARRALNCLHTAGVRNRIYLLFGLPGESDEDREATLSFVAEESHTLHDLNHAILNLPRRSPMHFHPERFGISAILPFHADSDLSLYDDFRCGDSHPRIEARRWLHSRFLKHPAVRRVVGRLRAPFKANHLCFLPPPRGIT